MFCRSCGAELPASSTFCSNCGNSTAPKIPSAPAPEPPAQKVSLLLGIGIALLPLIFSWVTLQKGYSLKARTISFGWLVVSSLFVFMGDGGGRSSGNRSSSVSRVSAPANQSAITETCLTMVSSFGPESNLSDLQKAELWKQFDGRPFTWNLEVVDVGEEILGGYYVQAKCVGSNSFVQDVRIGYRNKDAILNLKKGSVYSFTATLSDWSNFLGIQAVGD